jgi:inorganic pyrophosphatase/exopolyphosphatase
VSPLPLKIKKNLAEHQKIYIVLGNTSADMDSVMSSFAYASGMGPSYFPLINVDRADFLLRKDVFYVLDIVALNGDAFFFREDIPHLLELAKQGKAAFVLIDHNRLDPRQKELSPFVEGILDHHRDEDAGYPAHKIIRSVGSTATIVADQVLAQNPEKITAQTAFMLLSAILLDTKDLKDAGKTTSQDTAVAKLLKEKAGKLYTDQLYAVLHKKRQEVDIQRPDHILRKDFKIYEDSRIYYSISSLPRGIEWGRDNAASWLKAVACFLSEEKIDLWLGLVDKESGKELIFYSPRIWEALMKYIPDSSLNQILSFTASLPERHLLFYKLNKPLARKELQPMLSFPLLRF